MPKSSTRRDDDPPVQVKGRKAKSAAPLNGVEHVGDAASPDAAALNGAKSVRANGSSDAGNAGRSAVSSRSKRKLAVDAFSLPEDDATYDSGIDVGGKGDLDISSVDDLDQVERFDLGDTLHVRG